MITIESNTHLEDYVKEVLDLQPIQGREEDIRRFFNDPVVNAISTIEQLCKVCHVDPNIFTFEPSIHQIGVFKVVGLPYIYPHLAKLNLRVTAVAGSGKSSTIVKACHFIPKNLSVLICCFNVEIRREMQEKLAKEGLNNVDCNNVNSIGYKVLRNNLFKHFRRLGVSIQEASKRSEITLNDSKRYTYVKTYFDNLESLEQLKERDRDEDDDFSLTDYRRNILKLINLGRCFLASNVNNLQKVVKKYAINTQFNEIEVASSIIKEMTYDTNTIDFLDQLWMPVVLGTISKQNTGVRWDFPKYDIVFIDEAQDLSKVQRMLVLGTVKSLANSSGRCYSFGDAKQAILSFAGSDSDSFLELGMVPNCIDLPLTVSFRCPKGIEKYIKKHVPYFKCFDSNKDMVFIDKDSLNRTQLKKLPKEALVLCRNSAPLVRLSIHLMKLGIVSDLVGTNISENLVGFLKQHARSDNQVDTAINRMWIAYEKELERVMASNNIDFEDAEKFSSVIAIKDKLECIDAISEDCKTVSKLEKKIRSLFTKEARKDCIKLMTVHKSKGLETESVYILDAWLLKSRKSNTDMEREEEKNLHYVAHTRTSHKLEYIYSSDID